MIKPSVGRVLYFHPNGDPAVTHAAIITFVHRDDLVNLCSFLPNGMPVAQTSVPLLDELPPGAVPYSGVDYCEWMPFEKGQAVAADTPGGLMARVAALEAQIRELNPGLLPAS